MGSGTGQAADQDWMKMLTSSPLFKAVHDIEELIKDGVGPQGCIGAKGRPYIDIKVRKKINKYIINKVVRILLQVASKIIVYQ